jgi:WD40 repeat protein
MIAVGEGTTKQPEITVWKFNEEEEAEIYCVLKGHKLCIDAVMFSPNQKYLISVGDEHDKGLIVWDLE